jgi:DNA-binding transcriptional LysR family regulator
MNELSRTLDIDTVQAFVLVADFASFTRTAEAMDTSQAAVSLKLKRLEDRLGCRLIERTPRRVGLSLRGERFLPAARELLAAHDRALVQISGAKARRLTLGISDHVAGPELPLLLGRLNAYDPSLVIEVRIAASSEIMARYARGELDAAIARRGETQTAGEVLFTEPFRWFASPSFQQRPGEPLRLATMSPTCGIRALAVDALDEAGLAWTEAFVGGGVLALSAAVTAGIAVAALAQRVAPAGAVDVGERLGLPRLQPQNILLATRPTDRAARDMFKVVAAAFRGTSGR